MCFGLRILTLLSPCSSKTVSKVETSSTTADGRPAVSQMLQKNLREIRANLTARCNRVLLMYRRHCAPAVQQGQVSRLGSEGDSAHTRTAHLAGELQAATAIYALHVEMQTAERLVFFFAA